MSTRNLTKTIGRSRNRRPNIHIRQPVTQSAFRAFDYAKASGRPLNTYIVINMPQASALTATDDFCRIVHKFRDWLTNKAKQGQPKTPPIYVTSFENPDNNPHVNWVVHIPDYLKTEFQKKLPKWVGKVLGKIGPFDIHVQDVDVNYDKRLAKYILKGTDSRFIQHFHLDNVYEGPQGVIWGRRTAVSQAIGIKARKRADFHPGRGRPYRPGRIYNRQPDALA